MGASDWTVLALVVWVVITTGVIEACFRLGVGRLLCLLFAALLVWALYGTLALTVGLSHVVRLGIISTILSPVFVYASWHEHRLRRDRKRRTADLNEPQADLHH